MVKLSSRVRIFALRENTKRCWVDYKGTTERERSNDIQTKIWTDRTQRQYLSEAKMTERNMAKRVDDRLEAGYRGLKRFGRNAVKMVEAAIFNLGAISPGKRKKYKSRRWKSLRGLKEMYGEEEYHFTPVMIHVDERPPSAVWFCARWWREPMARKTW